MHRKLSDVDEDGVALMGQQQPPPQNQRPLTPRQIRELEEVVKLAEETLEEAEPRSSSLRKKRVEFEDTKTSPGSSDSNFLKKLRLRKRKIKILGFLGSKSQEATKTQEERAARLLKMYMPEKTGSSGSSKCGLNTISIHHTSRDRRFWRMRNRRRSSSS